MCDILLKKFEEASDYDEGLHFSLFTCAKAHN